MGYESNDIWGIDKDPEKEYDDRDIKDLERRVGSLKKKIEQQNEHIDNLKDKIGELREQDDWDDTRNRYDRTPRQQKIYDLRIDLREAENNLIKKTDDLKSLLNEIESIQKGTNFNDGHEVQSGYVDSYEREMNKRIEEHSKSLDYVEETSKQVSQQIDKVKTSLPEGTKQSTSRRRNLETSTPKQVYKPKPKPKVLAVDESTGDVYDINTGVVEEGDISIIGKANYNDDGSITGLTAESRTIAPNTYDLGSFVNLDKLLDENRATKIFNDNFKYSTMLNIMKAPEEANPLLTKEGKVRAKHQERAKKEYGKLVGEIVEERHRLYEELEEIKAYGFDLEDEIVKTLENKIAGLSYLEKELGLLMQRHGDSPLREEETPGSLRAVKDAYEKAEYMTQIGEGVGQAVHHLDGYNWFTGGRIDPSNLILLSNEIHDEFHDIYGKGNNSLEQFYEFLSNYHPQELPKFEEFLKGAKNIDEKLLGASEDWDNDTWRKQFNRWMSIPWISDIHDVDADIQYDKIPYSSFFLRNMEVPIDGTYKDSNGNEHDRAQVNTSSNTALHIYDSVTEQEMEKWENTEDLDILRHILHSRQITESINGMLKEEDVADIDKMKHWSKDKLLGELGESQIRGRLFLQSRNVGKELPFLGVGFDELDGENSPFSGTGLGSGFLPVMDKLKKFFDNYSDYFDIGENPLEGWDSNGDMSPFSTNANIIQRVFGDETFLQKLKNHIINKLPIDDTSGISTAHNPIKAKISRFNQEYYANPDDPEKKAFREARADISYLIGISKGGASIDTIGRFLAPKRTVTVGADEVEAYEEKGFYVIGKNKDGQVRLARDYARKPLRVDDSMNTWGKAPKPTVDKVTVDAGEVEAYENRGYRVVGEKGAKIVLAKDVYRDYPDDHPIGYSHPYRGVEIREGSGEEDDGWELGDEGFSRYDYGFDVDESILYPKPPSCCEQALKLLGEINETINSVGETIADALKNFKGGFRGSIYDENGMLNFDRGSSSSVGAEPLDKFYSGYKKRVNELEELINSTEDESIKKFAEDALSVAERMDKHGLRKSEWNQDLVYAIFGEYPKRENFSLEEEEKVRGELAEIRKTRRNSTTQEIFDENIKKIDKEIEKVKESSKNYFEDETDGRTLSKQSYLSRLEARRRKWENKEIIGEDKYKFLELEEEAYKKVLNQPSPTEHYTDHINNYIKGIEGVKGYHELGTRSRFLETRGRLNEMGIDVSEEEEKAVAKINRLVSSYKKELKKDISESEKDDIQRTIDKLLELKSLLDNNGEWWAPLPSNDVPNVINDMPMRGSSAFSSGIHNANVLLYGSDEELVRTFGKYWAEEDENGVRKLTPKRRERLLESLSPYRLQDDSEGETKQFTQTELAYKRLDYLSERYENTKETIERFRSNLDLLRDKGGAEQFDALIERLEYFKSELDSLADKDLRRTKLREQVKELTDDFYELSKTSERVLGDDLLRRAEEASLQSINERNRLGMSALFGDETAQKELFGEPPVPKPEKEPLRGRLTTMAYNFRQATQSATQLTGVVNKLFAIVGTGNAVNDMISASSIRQTNEIMLASRRGMEEAEKLYNRIQMLVVELPGNDTFLTNILTMLGTMDESLNAEDLEYMGGVIADYYMGAQAKGQFNNETERELRNYLMTGQTRNLTNSIIASEVESLKGLNTVKERTIALEKALQTTGMDSIAHYDSYTNTLEEFKGRFQKSFADLGDTYLGLLKMGMDLYNMLDRLTNSGLSQATIFGAVTVFGVLSATVVFAELLSISASLIEAFDLMTDFVKDTTKSYSGLAEAYRQIIGWIAVKIGLVDADTIATSANTVATDADTVSQQANAVAKMFGASATTADTVATDADTVATDANTVSIWGNILARLSSLKTIFIEIGARVYAVVLLAQEAIARYNNAFATAVENGTLISNTVTFIANIGARLWSIATKITSIALTWAEIGALGVLTVVLWGVIGALNVLTFLTTPFGMTLLAIVGVVWLMVKAFEGLGQIFGWWTDLGGMIEAIDAGIHRLWSAFMNSEPVQDIIKTFQNFAYTMEAFFNWIWNIGGNIWQTIFGVDSGTREAFDIVGAFLEIVGAVGNFIYWISPLEEILSIFDAIGSTIGWFLETWNKFVDTEEFQAIIKGFQDIRKTIGEAWGILTEAFGEVRDAFMSIFEDDEAVEDTKESMNVLLEILKAIATIINWTIIPLIKMVAGFVKGVAGVVKTVADIFNGFVGLFTNTGDFVGNVVNLIHSLTDFIVTQFLGIPMRILDGMSGGILSAIGLGGNNANLGNQKQLAQNYAYQTSNTTHVINNNFQEGSVQTDARNMTAKDVRKLFTGAFGYNKARGTQGILN